MAQPDEFEVYNDTTEQIPAGGLAYWSGGFTSQGALKLVKPTADSQPYLVVVGEFSVPAKANGKGTFATRCMVAFDPTVGGRPAQGDTVGSVAGSWYAKKGNTGFKVFGGSAGNWAACVRSAELLTVEEVDATPSLANTLTLRFDQADGFAVSQPAAGVARVGFTLPDAVREAIRCDNCDWLAGMGSNRCMKVSVNGTDTGMYLFTEDGNTWTAGDLLTICGTDYVVEVKRNAGGVPILTLTVPGSGGAVKTGQWKCCGCAFAKWVYNLQDLCPDEPDTGNPCTNVVDVRVDLVDCPFSCPTGIPAALGTWYEGSMPPSTSHYYCMPITPGTYRVKGYATMNFSGNYLQIGTSTCSDGRCEVVLEAGVGFLQGVLGIPADKPEWRGTAEEPICQEFTIGEGVSSLCIRVRNVNAGFTYDFGFQVEAGDCEVGSYAGCADGAAIPLDTFVQVGTRGTSGPKYVHVPVTPGNTYHLEFEMMEGGNVDYAESTFTGTDCTGTQTAGPSGTVTFDMTVGEITIPPGNNCLCIAFHKSSPDADRMFRVAVRPGPAP